MKKLLSNIAHFFGYFFRKNIPTVEQAIKMGLKHGSNVHGDMINTLNCRSWWKDKYGNTFYCNQLLEGGRDIFMAHALIQMREGFEKLGINVMDDIIKAHQVSESTGWK